MSVNNISPIFFESVSMVTAAPKAELGTVRVENGVKYVLAYNAGGAATGTGVAMSRPASAAAGLYSGSVSSVSGDMPIGWVKHATIPAGEYGWLVTKGLVTVAVASSASDQAAGVKMLGANGLIATLGTGYPCGELTTIIVSGNSGSFHVHLATT